MNYKVILSDMDVHAIESCIQYCQNDKNFPLLDQLLRDAKKAINNREPVERN